MSGFVVAAALMTIAALAFVLPPLLRQRALLSEDRDAANAAFHREQMAELERERAAGTISESAYAESKREIERRLLEDLQAKPAPAAAAPASRGIAVAVGVLLPAIAVGGYLWVGTPAALDPVARISPEATHKVTPEQIAAMVERLSARLEKNPDDLEGWTMLARSRLALGQYQESLKAYEKLAQLAPGDPNVLADYADAMAMARGRKLQGEPYALVQQALKSDPRHVKSLALAGSAEFEMGEYAKAVASWERLLDIVGRETDFGKQVSSSVEEARERGKLGPAKSSPVAKAEAKGKAEAKPAAKAEPAGREAIVGVVKLAPALAKQAAPGDVLFVFARPADGSRMPVAIQRVKAESFPLRFTLDDSTAMSPAAKLSTQGKVIVEARLSKSGDATPKKGDLRGVSTAVAPGTTGLEILIDSVVE